ncbi:MAG: tRNA (N6-isopentenyl adenosine(37)-C2)-methylthiotransferase MiaB, partial [Bacilli bacterium]|nr:tRNA (N6-isopentenyl adenosine(37)-C2)-methylthiotransferase MiaB [Bacilli bacterium]
MNLPDMNEAKKRKNETVEYIYTDVVKSNSYKDKKYFIKTYGCQMNVHDSEEISGLLENLGYTKVESEMEADLIVLNTCAIRENAHDKVFGFLGRCKHIKKEKKDIMIVLCGCMAQEKSVVDE